MSKYNEHLHFDEWGMITHLGKSKWGQDEPDPYWHDGGDSGHRMGNFYTMTKANEILKAFPEDEFLNQDPKNYVEALPQFFQEGNFRRHPDPKYWYSAWDRGSRDLFAPNIIALGVLGLRAELKEAFIAHLKRGLLFTTNTRKNEWNGPATKLPIKLPDLTLFEYWSYYIRGFSLWPLYPLLVVLDLEFFINAIIRRFDNDNDVNNFITNAVYTRIKYPTPLSWLALKLTSRSDMYEKVDEYYRNVYYNNIMYGSPSFVGEAMKKIIEKIFGSK